MSVLPDLTQILRELLRDPNLNPIPSTCFEDLDGWDLMDLVTVVVEAECRFGVEFELSEIDHLVTLDDLDRMIEAKRTLAAA